ncbi:nickel pincer cofactor biosynthesis protein LarC [Gracilibacillus sp. S3-1-1]|uniref:Nickel pincer cofactor biosynthesis protein LarC n=1 Tax=Gracilibacillus pellucidus TaxID=3095368 RepID=A0ACC6M2K8_9BACI|nr:nickel pincer cofactor biosynthesis protein LarC [Gracilibacillus sp. S3-1-1]MDX8045186.1 nickel pincer cofactor biosynthesis protein LarC [Gracilibacillus sp. S3-1-1]
MTKTLYFDCFTGISGDMTIAALLDTGISFEWFENELKALGLAEEYELKLHKVIKNGINSNKFDVIYENNQQEHDHTHNHHEHSHQHDHTHNHHHHGHNHSHSHHHRHYKDIVQLIEQSELNDSVKRMSLEMFREIGEAEAKIHGMDLQNVHFHEVGAIDSIIDIVGTAILVDALKVDKIISASVPVGSGHIHIDHGIYPVPAPATLEVLKGVPLKESKIKGELTTPTGAAIIKTLAKEFSTMPNFKVEKIGYGAGTKTFDNQPNVLRIIVGESV